MPDLQLSKNFWLSEFLTSQTASRSGICNMPSQAVIKNLKILCTELLQPLRDDLELPLIISSGYRSPQLNKLVGGSQNSQHMQGNAVDFIVPNLSLIATAKFIIDNPKYKFDQLILEFDSWLHISFNSSKNRMHLLTINSYGTSKGIKIK
jgi:zinc D-Ala-D-Ala carboxypeptidase